MPLVGLSMEKETLNNKTIELMAYAVGRYANTVEQAGPDTWYSDAEVATVYILSKAKEFKYGNGHELIAVTDGGKNQWDKPVKYVKFFNHFKSTNTAAKNGVVKTNDKVYTFSHDKAKEMWNTKVQEGFERVK